MYIFYMLRVTKTSVIDGVYKTFIKAIKTKQILQNCLYI